ALAPVSTNASLVGLRGRRKFAPRIRTSIEIGIERTETVKSLNRGSTASVTPRSTDSTPEITLSVCAPKFSRYTAGLANAAARPPLNFWQLTTYITTARRKGRLQVTGGAFTSG